MVKFTPRPDFDGRKQSGLSQFNDSKVEHLASLEEYSDAGTNNSDNNSKLDDVSIVDFNNNPNQSNWNQQNSLQSQISVI